MVRIQERAQIPLPSSRLRRTMRVNWPLLPKIPVSSAKKQNSNRIMNTSRSCPVKRASSNA